MSIHRYYGVLAFPAGFNVPVAEAVRAGNQVAGQLLPSVGLFLSKQDQIVNSEETEKMYDRFGSLVKQKIYIEDAEHGQHHVIAGDILSPNTTERIAKMMIEDGRPLEDIQRLLGHRNLFSTRALVRRLKKAFDL